MATTKITNTSDLFVLNAWQGTADDGDDGWANDFYYSCASGQGLADAVLAADYEGATHSVHGSCADGAHFLVRGADAAEKIAGAARAAGYLVDVRSAWVGRFGDGQGDVVEVVGA